MVTQISALNPNNANSSFAISQLLKQYESQCKSEVLAAAQTIFFKLLVENRVDLGKPYVNLKNSAENSTLTFLFCINQYLLCLIFEENKTSFLVENCSIGFEKEGELQTPKSIDRFVRLLKSIQTLQLHQAVVVF
ncbi:MAG: hypothetical protein RML72_03015 [Bacteroidia bacterium]|nr:hypothetical protein [Bacteroidia bacterium]MDW8157832.1 hypothetical protein [Bacteroidia bacterium]